MLTGATPKTTGNGRRASQPAQLTWKGEGNPHHFLAGGQGALPRNLHGPPVERGLRLLVRRPGEKDLTHNFFLETGARNNKLKVYYYEMVEHPAARALTGYLLVRGGVHQVAYARALEHLTGANLTELFPAPRIPTTIRSAGRTSSAATTCACTASPRATTSSWPPYSTAPIPRPEKTSRYRRASRGRARADCRPNRRCSRPTMRPRRSPRSQKLRTQAGLPKAPTGEVANGDGSKPKSRTTRRPKTAAKK